MAQGQGPSLSARTEHETLMVPAWAVPPEAAKARNLRHFKSHGQMTERLGGVQSSLANLVLGSITHDCRARDWYSPRRGWTLPACMVISQMLAGAVSHKSTLLPHGSCSARAKHALLFYDSAA